MVCILRKPRRASPKIFSTSKKKFQIQLILANPASYFLRNLQISVKSKTIFEIAKLLSKPKKKLFIMLQNYWESENILLNQKIFSNPTFIFCSIILSLSPKKSHKSENLLPNLEKLFEIGKKKIAKSAHFMVNGWQMGNQNNGASGHVTYFNWCIVHFKKCTIHQLIRRMIHLNSPT